MTGADTEAKRAWVESLLEPWNWLFSGNLRDWFHEAKIDRIMRYIVARSYGSEYQAILLVEDDNEHVLATGETIEEMKQACWNHWVDHNVDRFKWPPEPDWQDLAHDFASLLDAIEKCRATPEFVERLKKRYADFTASTLHTEGGRE